MLRRFTPRNAGHLTEDAAIAKPIRYIAYAFLALIILLAGAIGAAILLIDTDDVKAVVERQVAEHTRLQLTLGGDLGWSIFPLGLELSAVSTTLDGEPFASIDRLVAQVDLWALLERRVEVHTVLLEGLNANLVTASDGTGNWERILPESAPADAAPGQPPAVSQPQPAPIEPAAAGAGIDFNVEKIRIDNAQVHYSDASGQRIDLREVSLSADDIQLGATFPLTMSLGVSLTQPQTDIRASLEGNVTVDEALQKFAVKNLVSKVELQGKAIGGKTVNGGLEGAVSVDTAKQQASLSQLTAQLANLTLTTDLEVHGFGEAPQLSGKLQIAEFSLRQLLEQLGQTVPVTADANVLGKVAFSTDIGGEPGTVALTGLSLTLDDTRFSGALSYALANSAIRGELRGNRINVDRYLPPPPAEPVPAQKPATPLPETDLLPLETIRALVWSLTIGMNEVIASGLTVQELLLKSSAENGVIKVSELKAKLYEGTLQGTANIDARSEMPQWQVQQQLTGLQMQPFLMALAEVDMLSGPFNATVNLGTRGNRISVLRANADGTVGFGIPEGNISGVNMSALACQGIALANKTTIDTSTWPKSTAFRELKANMLVKGNLLDNQSIKAALDGLALEGKGTVNATTLAMDYRAGLRITGPVSEDPACEYSEKLTGVVIPVRCEGNLSEAGASLCSFHRDRFLDTLKDLGKAELKEKAEKKVDKKLDKYLKPEESGDPEKEAAKELFRGLLRK